MTGMASMALLADAGFHEFRSDVKFDFALHYGEAEKKRLIGVPQINPLADEKFEEMLDDPSKNNDNNPSLCKNTKVQSENEKVQSEDEPEYLR